MKMASNSRPPPSACGKILCLMAVLLYSDMCLGASLTLIRPSEYAVLNAPFTLTCTVTDAANLDDRVIFSRGTLDATLAALWQNLASCSMFTDAPGYNVSCGSGTGSSSTTTKTYTLRIENVAQIDLTVWACWLQTPKIYSNNITVTIKTSSDEGAGLAGGLAGVTLGGIALLIIIVCVTFTDKTTKKILIIVLLVMACILLILALVTAILVGMETDITQDAGWIAAAALCAIGFVFGIIFVAIGVWQILKTGSGRNRVNSHDDSLHVESFQNPAASNPAPSSRNPAPRILPPLDLHGNYQSEDMDQKKKKKKKKTQPHD